jgi:pilus assembly protein FimV
LRVGADPAPGPLRGLAQVSVFAAALCVLASAAAPAQAQKKPRHAPAPAQAAQPPAAVLSAYEVAQGDTLFRIAGKTRPPGVTLHQMVLALYRANPDAFLDGNINQLVVGRTLTIPTRDAVLAVDAAKAAEELKTLVARRAAAPAPAPAQVQPAVPAAREPAPAKPKSERPAKPSAGLTKDQAEERYQSALQAERSGDIGGAMVSYLAAADAGHGLAQKRLGDIYNTGNDIVRRDYETALRWYQKAREQGIQIPRPLTHTPTRPN